MKGTLIEYFNSTEEENGLFDLKDHQGFPVWDILRYHVFTRYCYPAREYARSCTPVGKKKRDYLLLLRETFKFCRMVVFGKKNKLLIQTASRYRNDRGEYFDKPSQALIRMAGKKAFVLETHLRKKTESPTRYDFCSFSRRMIRKDQLDTEIYDTIRTAMQETFGEFPCSYQELNGVYGTFTSDQRFYSWFFSIVKPCKVFTAVGNPKAFTWAAQKKGIPTFLFQHAGIVPSESEYCYPPSIHPQANIIFPDTLLTFSPHWGKNMNIPAKKILPVGNDFFYSGSVDTNAAGKNTLLVISTIVHGPLLAEFFLEYAHKNKDCNLLFKLHPNEYHLRSEYEKRFAGAGNVTVIGAEKDTTRLIDESGLVVVIVSTVVYEALDRHKKVAIYKKLNYQTNLHIKEHPNLYFFDTAEELDNILTENCRSNDSWRFYSPADRTLLSQLINEKPC